jgi:ethanolamine utilization protein EutQ (cupin superfamily)
MEDVIRRIIEIEDEARRIIDDSIADKKRKEKEHKERIEVLEQKIISDAKRKVEQIREREFAEIEEKERLKVEKCSKHIQSMRQHGDENMDRWVKELVDRVIG